MVSFSFYRIGTSLFSQSSIAYSESVEILVSHPTQESLLESINVPRRRATFYNIFIPNGLKHSGPAIQIVKEQLAALKRSSMWNSTFHQLFYNVIGYNATAEIQQECGPQCHLLQFVQEGDEVLTLQSLHDYCQEHSDSLVTYIHDKGSHHPSKKNNNLRVLLTKSVTSDACQEVGMRKNTSCDVCGARFSPFPHHHMPGNMWTAPCSYIRKLHRPDEFRQRMDDLMDKVLHHAKEDIPKPSVEQFKIRWFVGTGRFASEHWVTSHPSIRPCDVYAPVEYQRGYKVLPEPSDEWIPDLRPAPRFPPSVLFRATTQWENTWYCGKGHLLEYRYLYNELPPEDSFVWSFYSEASEQCQALNFTQHRSLYANLSEIFIDATNE